jgi:Methyltransferase domain
VRTSFKNTNQYSIIDDFSETCSLQEQLPFNNDTFDLVRMSCLALCITSDSWGYVLREVCRVLVAGGRLEFIDDQIFLPYGEEPLRSEGRDDGSDHDGGGVVHGHKGKGREKLKPSIVLSPEAWERSLSISDLDALFERMLLDAFDIYKDPSDIILPLMSKIFGQAQEVETMNLVLAPPDSSGRFPQHHCPGLILWPSTFIPMDHTEVEIHASKHLRTLLSCKNFLAQHAIKIAELEGERVDEEFVSQALWKYERFLIHPIFLIH